jgi:hypothetical protein
LRGSTFRSFEQLNNLLENVAILRRSHRDKKLADVSPTNTRLKVLQWTD